MFLSKGIQGTNKECRMRESKWPSSEGMNVLLTPVCVICVHQSIPVGLTKSPLKRANVLKPSDHSLHFGGIFFYSIFLVFFLKLYFQTHRQALTANVTRLLSCRRFASHQGKKFQTYWNVGFSLERRASKCSQRPLVIFEFPGYLRCNL